MNKTVVSQDPHRKRKKLETGSMTLGANSSLVVMGKRGWQMIGPWKLLLWGPPNQTKRSPQPLDSYVHSLPLKCLGWCTGYLVTDWNLSRFVSGRVQGQLYDDILNPSNWSKTKSGKIASVAMRILILRLNTCT